MSRKQLLGVSVVTIILLLLLLAVFQSSLRYHLVDFTVFHTAGERFLAGASLYQASDGHYQFKYVPSSAACFVPFALLPLEIAKFIWLVVTFGSVVGVV